MIFAGKSLERDACLALKTSPIRLISHVFGTTPLQRGNLIGRPFPRRVRDICRAIPSPCTDDLECEVKWSAALFIRYADELRELLSLVRQATRALLLGQYDTTRALLKQIQDEFGYSLWCIKLTLLLDELDSGLEGNRRTRQRLAEDSPNLVLFFLHFFSQQSEATVSADDYNDTLNAFLTRDVIGAPLASYYGFRLGSRPRPAVADLPTILSYEEAHSLLDRYWVWCQACRLWFTQHIPQVDDEVGQSILGVAEALDDVDAWFLAAIVDHSRAFEGELFAGVYKIVDAYTRGDYVSAQAGGESLLSRYPECFELYELTVKSSLQLQSGLQPSLPSDSIAASVADSISQVLQRSAVTQEHLRLLRRLGCRLHSTSLSPAIDAFVQQHSTDAVPLRLDVQTSLAGAIPTPRVFATLFTESEALAVLESLMQTAPQNAAIQLFLADQHAIQKVGEHPCPYPPLPEARRVRHQAFVEETLGHFELALHSYDRMSSLVDQTSVHHADVRAGALRCLFKLDRLSDCLRMLADSCAKQPHLISGSMLKEVLSRYDLDDSATQVGDIAWPILEVTAQVLRAAPLNQDRLHDFLDDFLSFHGCRKPTELLLKRNLFAKEELVALLRDVCTTNVLQASIWYDSQEEVEKERIQLCKWLAENDEPSSRFLDEIADLTRAAAIRELVHEADRSRVYVDTSGIVGTLPEVTCERAYRCASLFLLRDDTLKQCLDLVGFDLSTLTKKRIVFHDEGVKLFVSLFTELKDLFLGSTQYGLDANLSQRIRHGTLAGEIRAHFENHHLVTYMGQDGNYTVPVHWLERRSPLSSESATALTEAVARLSESVDSLIANVRNEWIQIRTDDGPEMAMFDYNFTDGELYDAYASLGLSAIDDQEEAIGLVFDKVFQTLWSRTDANLDRIRNAILNVLRDDLFALIDDFEKVLVAKVGYAATADLRTAIANCRTAIGNGLYHMSEWFRSGVKQRVPDSEFAHLAAALTGVVAQYCGPTQVECVPMVDAGLTVPGHAFRGVWDILFILMDNAAKHSVRATTSAGLCVSRDAGSISICVTNGVDNSVALETLQQSASSLSKLHAAPEDLAATRQEGGSGHVKLRKILRYDLGCPDYSIRACVNEQHVFTVSVTMKPGWSDG